MYPSSAIRSVRHIASILPPSRRTAAVIRQNLTVAISVMLVFGTSRLLFDLPLPLAVVGHEGGTVLIAVPALLS